MSNQYIHVIFVGTLAATALSGCSGNGGPVFAALDAAKLAGPHTPTSCALDYVNGAGEPHATFYASAPVGLQGWIIDANKRPPQKFFLALKGAKAYAIDGHAGAPRPDVAKAYGDPNALNSGFNLSADATAVPAGSYSAFLFIEGTDGAVQVCETSWKIDVKA